MQKNDLYKHCDTIIRILACDGENVLIIDCTKLTVPKYIAAKDLKLYSVCSSEDLYQKTGVVPLPIDSLSAENKSIAYKRFTMIAGILPFINEETERCYMTRKIAEKYNVSLQTVKNTLCLFLAYQTVSVLAPKSTYKEKPLTEDEKNIRWALNKFFYNTDKNSLQTAYTLMLKEKYCDSLGQLPLKYPSIHQFRYYYQKHRNMQNYYVSRNGLKNYQRNNRPLTGDGIQAFAPFVGVGMLDSTICDIYLVNDSGNVVGRPILTACIDGFSGLCCGYTLSWEGGVYSIRTLLLNVITDKVKWCSDFGINIKENDWDCNGILPGILVTDMGSEYKSENFEQIAELGVTIVNLPAYRPELKGAVEKFFDVVQNLFKPHLKGKGVIESDFQERGSHDYRLDARLTMDDFEIIIIRCIVHYNTKQVLDNFPYSERMIKDSVSPFSSDIWNWGRKQDGANLIPVNTKQLILTLLPRTTGKFSRFGLKVNKLRYHCEGYTEQYLTGGSVTVAFNPDDVSTVWVIENGNYIQFDLVESRFEGKPLNSVNELLQQKKELINSVSEESLQSQICLAQHIETISEKSAVDSVGLNRIRNTRKKERVKRHNDIMKGGNKNE